MLKITSFSEKNLNTYSVNDYILPLVIPNSYDKVFSENFICNQWLISSKIKRMLFHEIYGDLLVPGNKRLKILDIGGGVNLIQKVIAKNHDYTVIDILSHDSKCEDFYKMHKINLLNSDWSVCIKNLGKFDLVISNDLFPNVDQRLDEFLKSIFDIGNKFRILITFYSNKFYFVKRIDADEVMCLKSWNLQNVKDSLINSPFRVPKEILDQLNNASSTLFSNKRKVALFEASKIIK
jgi:hypothetical protein